MGAVPPALVFAGVTVINVRDGRLHPRQTVVVVGNHIQAVGSTRRVRVPAGARVIRADGTYLIPGLWDMHVHTNEFPRTVYPLFIANGVTGVREMSAISLDSVHHWRREILAGTRVGPRVINPGPIVMYGKPSGSSHCAWCVTVATPEEGRRMVDSLQAAGADFIKVYDGHPRAVYFAIAAETRRVGLMLAGHLPGEVTAREASDSGQRSIEHWLACDTRTQAGGEQRQNTFNPQECPALAARFRRNGTWFSIAYPYPFLPGAGLLNPAKDPMRYWPDSVLNNLGIPSYDSLRDNPNYLPGPAAERSVEQWAAAARSREQWAATHYDSLPLEPPLGKLHQRALGKLHRAGIRLLAGTDTGLLAWGCIATVPGFSLHSVLWWLVQAGLTPLEALQTATLNPAEYFQATDTLGTIAPGKLADFVLLDANPLVDIYNTRRIRAVVANGRFFDRGDLDALLVETERLARSSRRPGASPP